MIHMGIHMYESSLWSFAQHIFIFRLFCAILKDGLNFNDMEKPPKIGDFIISFFPFFIMFAKKGKIRNDAVKRKFCIMKKFSI